MIANVVLSLVLVSSLCFGCCDDYYLCLVMKRKNYSHRHGTHNYKDHITMTTVEITSCSFCDSNDNQNRSTFHSTTVVVLPWVSAVLYTFIVRVFLLNYHIWEDTYNHGNTFLLKKDIIYNQGIEMAIVLSLNYKSKNIRLGNDSWWQD